MKDDRHRDGVRDAIAPLRLRDDQIDPFFHVVATRFDDIDFFQVTLCLSHERSRPIRASSLRPPGARI